MNMLRTGESRSTKKNQILLMFILLLDLIGFSLIFPLIPSILDFYLKGAATTPLDGWLPPVVRFLDSLLPLQGGQGAGEAIVITGGVLTSLYSLLQFLFTPFWGRLSDRLGRRPVLILTSLGLALSYLLWSLSSSMTFFILSRVLGGIMAGNMGVASAAMADMSTPEHRTRAMGMLGAAFGLGFIIGPVVGGLSSRWDMSTTFPALEFLHPFSFCALFSFLFSLGSAWLNYRFFHETAPERTEKSTTWLENPMQLFRNKLSIPGFTHLLVVNFFFLFLFSGLEFSLSFFYKLDFHLTPLQIGLVFLYSGMVIVLGQGGLVRYLSGRIHARQMALLGLFLLPLPVGMLSYSPPSLMLSLLWLFPISLGASLVQPSLSSLSSLMSPMDRQGLALGVFRSSGSLARAVGPLAGAYLYWFMGIHFAYTLLALSLFLSFLLGLGLKNVRN